MTSSHLLVLTSNWNKSVLQNHLNFGLQFLRDKFGPSPKRIYVKLENKTSQQNGTIGSNISLAKSLHRLGIGYPEIDLRLLLSNLKKDNFQEDLSKLSKLDSLLFAPKTFSKSKIEEFIRISKLDPKIPFEILQIDEKESNSEKSLNGSEDSAAFDHTVIGGTFDQTHAGHKILLTESQLRSKISLTIGVTDGPMIASKTLSELILPCEERIHKLRDYLVDCDPTLEYDIVPILDPFGPSTVKENLSAIIGSRETERGCLKVNEIRKEKGLSELRVFLIELENNPHAESGVEEDKISSSSRRIRLLGTLLKPPIKSWSSDDGGPYVIGLTGGSATGKTSISRILTELAPDTVGAVDCDKIGHEAYLPGSDCYGKLVGEFGPEIVDGDKGPINRAKLGSLIFTNPENKTKLESIVWPEIEKATKAEIGKLYREKGKNVVVVDAAALLEAGWHERFLHEIWTCVIPEKEAARRISERDGKSEDEAKKRLEAQKATNAKSLKHANVIFCTQWSVDFTRKQVEMAWLRLAEQMQN